MRKSMNICLGCCLALLVLLLSACSNISSTVTTNANIQTQTQAQSPATKIVVSTPTPTPKQLLDKSNNTMNNLTAVHFTLDAKRQNIAPTTSTTPAGSILQTLLPLPGGAAYNSWKQGEGDEAGANISQINLKAKWALPQFQPGSGYSFTMDQHIQGDNVYLLGEPIANQKWYVISKKTLAEQPDTQVYALSGMSQIRALIELALHKGILSDKGQENIGGTTLHHIQATFNEEDRTALRAIDVENYSTFFASMQTENTSGSSDFWIDTATGYVHRVSSTIVYKTTASDAVRAMTMQQTLTFNCSRFNQPITIPIPQQPISTNSIDQIYHYQP
ncbi:hypothetical protein [Dictyobacter formicarum]|uniref:Lipoprotein n=1 Tax=Dictyobacter formicarum TaxID=2778368 RepID=A0ABQ3VC44_9CHLR|nr:hypothetical protein [Dictyobacter formicarum]GHO83727.1 hypothetical protein KSZ_17330 [Dictyobacter formicarum]